MSTPRERVRAECARVGAQSFARGCAAVLAGDLSDGRLIDLLAGDAMPALRVDPERDDVHWFRVWAVRGLMWGWHDEATAALLSALDDDAWRVRELAAKVVARHGVDAALDTVAALRDDPVVRVRAAADRAVRALAGSGQASQATG